MSLFLLGAIAMASLTAALLFLRFWRETGDRLFLLFAISFGIEGVNRTLLALSPAPQEGDALFFVVRLASFLLILYAVAEKNRAVAPQKTPGEGQADAAGPASSRRMN